MSDKIKKSDDEWRDQLNDEQYRICRQKGTERAFTGEYYNCKTPGTYKCACCGNPLFESGTKYDSGSGWPSFYQPIEPKAVEEDVDTSLGMRRVEVMCNKCGAHLGHVFEDGPRPTGLRYCVNSVALELEKKD